MSARRKSTLPPPPKISRLILLAILPICFYFFHLYQLLLAPHLLVVWLQNSDELRATGGFLGSVAWVESRGVWPHHFQLRDIYELGGHVRTYVEPPLAVKTYLSGGGSWRLQDVNWDRDFAVSAARFNDFLSLTSEKNSLPPGKKADLIIAVNLSLIESLFDEIGGVTIADPQLTITGDNFADLARARRPRQDQRDFPKMDLLKLAAGALAEKLQSLPLAEKLSLLPWFWQQTQSREVQFFSPHLPLQAIFASAKIAGLTPDIKSRNDLYLLDSNVGINKVNRYVTRTHNLELAPAQNSASHAATLNLSWQNTCDLSFFSDDIATASARSRQPATTNTACNYANYFRLLLDTDTTLQSIYITAPSLENPTAPPDTFAPPFATRNIIDSQNHLWQEIGFLIIVQPNSTVSARLELSGKNPAWQVN
jgi:hypothetical protein